MQEARLADDRRSFIQILVFSRVSLGLRIQVLFGPACIDPCILRISVRDGSVLHSESQH